MSTTTVSSIDISSSASPVRSVLLMGSKGSAVRQLQRNLNACFEAFEVIDAISVFVDGFFGNETLSAVKYLQCVAGFPVNGRVDEATWQFIEHGVAGLPVLTVGSVGTCVAAVQKTIASAGVSLVADGQFGDQMSQAIKCFQQAQGVVASGIVGFETWECIVRLRLNALPCVALLPDPYQR